MRRRRSLASRHLKLAQYIFCLILLFAPSVVSAQSAAGSEDILRHPIQKLSDQDIGKAFAKKPEQNLQPETPQNIDGVEEKPAAPTINATPSINGSVNMIVHRPEDDLLIFSLKLAHMTLLDVLLTFEDLDSGRYYIPFVDFVQALEFPADYDERGGLISGWFLDEARTFSIDLRAGTARVDGRDYTLSPDHIERHEDGVYVSLDMIQKWFPLTLEVDFSQLAVVVKSLEPLPIEVRIARDAKRGEIEDGAGGRYRNKEYPLRDTPPPLFGAPTANVSAQSTYDNNESLDNPFAVTMTMLASGIVAGQDAVISINDNSQDDSGPDIRASIGLKDPDNNLFGIGGSEYRLGDVATNAIPLISTGTAGRGAYFSTMPYNSGASQSGTTQLRGELPVGYQVDVMRNGQLLGFLEEPDANGEYVFDLDVFPGLNVFELVFYGPQGQKDVKEERIYVAANPVEKGSIGFRGSLIQDNTNLFTNRKISNDDDQGAYRFTAEAEYGLTDISSFYLALADISFEGERERYGIARYSRSIKGARTDFSYARSSSGGQSASLRVQSVVRGIRWQLEHILYKDFESEDTEREGLGGQLANSTNLRVSGLLPIIKHTPFSLNVDRLENEEGVERISWRGRVTKNVKKLRVTSEVEQVIEDEQERQTDLSVQVSSRFDKINIRGNMSYEIEPDFALNDVSLSADWRVDKRTNARMEVRRSGSEDPVHSLTLGASRAFDPIQVGLNVSYDDEGDMRAILGTSFGLGYNPHEKKPFMTHKRIAQKAIFAPRVYYDKNNNNIFDEGDEWMEGVHFAGAGVDREVGTNAKGVLVLPSVEAYERTTFELNTSSLPDPFMRSARTPEDYVLRPSQIVRSDYPVILVGEVDGNIYVAKYGDRRNAQSITIELVSKETGEVVQSGKSEFDGFFWVQDVPVGVYQARLSPKQVQDLGFCQPKAQDVSLTEDETFKTLGDYLLWPRGQEGRVHVILGEAADVRSLKDVWGGLVGVIPDFFLEEISLPDAYIVQAMGEDTSYKLILHDLSKEEGQAVCDGIGDQANAMCHIQDAQALCAHRIVKVDQLTKIEDASKTDGGDI